MKSFKQMIKDGAIKRADAMKVRIEDIHEEPGFNLRLEGEDLDASIEALAAYIADGGIVPPLEVRPREGGGVYVVDGHRRRRAYLRVRDKVCDANGELWVSVVAFAGNDAERVARVITSSEGRPLSLLEAAEGYRRLTVFGWTAEQIARKVGKTRQHVDQALILAHANSDVHRLVAAGKVSATTAIEAVRKHGEKAGEILSRAVEKAAKDGKGKATAGAVHGKALPRKVVSEVVQAVRSVGDRLPRETAEVIATLHLRPNEKPPMVQVPADVVLALLEVSDLVRETEAKQAERGRAKTAKRAQADVEGAAA